jgi:hypothetical protein
MKQRIRILLGVAVITGLVVPAAALASSGGTAAAAPSSKVPIAYTCTGGDFGSGIYASITIAGACAVTPNATVTVIGNVNVDSDAVFDAQSAPSKITVGGDITAASGSLLGLGCQPNPPKHTTGHPCTVEKHRHSTIVVVGNVTTTDANTVLLNGITVGGNVTLLGGGDQAGNPWPLKNNWIGGDLVVSGATPEWFGAILNKVDGSVILTNITVAAGVTIDIASNTVGRNLTCWGLAPAVSGGFTGEVNVVGGQALGQCANLMDQSSPSS